jgi:hypothetical protein
LLVSERGRDGRIGAAGYAMISAIDTVNVFPVAMLSTPLENGGRVSPSTRSAPQDSAYA